MSRKKAAGPFQPTLLTSTSIGPTSLSTDAAAAAVASTVGQINLIGNSGATRCGDIGDRALSHVLVAIKDHDRGALGTKPPTKWRDRCSRHPR